MSEEIESIQLTGVELERYRDVGYQPRDIGFHLLR